MEIAFKMIVMIGQICAVCMVGAAIADHIVQPAVSAINARRMHRAEKQAYQGH